MVDVLPVSLQSFDTDGWATGRALGLQKNWTLVCWWWQFRWSFAHATAPVVTNISITMVQPNPECRHSGTALPRSTETDRERGYLSCHL